MRQVAMAALVATLMVGCGSEEAHVYQSPKSEAKPSAMSAGAMPEMGMPVGDEHQHTPYDCDMPEGWLPQSASGMRLISFKVPVGEASLDGSVVQLGSAAGDVVSNVNRWRGQVGLAPAEAKDIMAEMKEYDSSLGKFKFFKFANPENPQSAILAGMYHLDQVVVFAKVIGPLEAINAQESAFLAFCRSLRAHQH